MQALLSSLFSFSGPPGENGLLDGVASLPGEEAVDSGGFSAFLAGELGDVPPEILEDVLAHLRDNPEFQTFLEQMPDGKSLPPAQLLMQFLAATGSTTTGPVGAAESVSASGLGSNLAFELASPDFRQRFAGKIALQDAVAQGVQSAISDKVVAQPAQAGTLLSDSANPLHGTLFDKLLEKIDFQPKGFAAMDVVPSANPTLNAGQVAALTQIQNPGQRLQSLLPSTNLDVPLRDSGWDQGLGERVLWMVNQKLQGAELRLNPPQLGPIEVRVDMRNDQASITFTAQHGAVREALEAAMPRLREMFAGSGMDLVNVNVSQQSLADQQRDAQGAQGEFSQAEAESSGADGAAEGDVDQTDVSSLPARLALGVVDLFA